MNCEIEKRKEGSKRYLCIKNFITEENEFRIQMILNNNIKKILPTKISMINNKKELVCETTGLVAIGSMYDRKRMTARELVTLAQNIKKLMEELHKYLLNVEDIVFEADYIYYSKVKKEYVFCYCPGLGADYQLGLKELFNQILDYVDHNDKETVEVAYGMQNITTQVEFTIEEIIEYGVTVINKSIIEDEKDFPIEDEPTLIEGTQIVEEKTNILKRLWDKIRGNKDYVTKDELEDGLELGGDNLDAVIEPDEDFETFDNKSDYDSFGNENENMDRLDVDEDEDKTMLLTGLDCFSLIKLKSVNDDGDILIVPLSFPYSIGKKKTANDYSIDSPAISRKHANICMEDNNYFIEDLKSTNGTYVNGVRIKPMEKIEIKEGDIVKLADVELEVMC